EDAIMRRICFISTLFFIMLHNLKKTISDIKYEITINIMALVVNSLFIIEFQFLKFLIMLKQLFVEINFKLKLICYHKIMRAHDLRTQMSVLNVRSLAGLHENLCSVIKMINYVYSVPLLLSIILVLFYLIFCVFMFISKVFNNENFKCIPIHVYVIFFYFLSKAIIIIYYCKICSSKANRTGVLVHQVLRFTINEKIREELELFSLQLLHQKVQFTACGFFPLDFTLLYSVVGAVTTYLVILLQFQQQFVL
ncbi:hypothetical protein L9F63_010387, partial [Diploptera punctata]